MSPDRAAVPWAFLRYLAYFDEKAGALTVGPEGRSLVGTQRRVASEELGVGFSLFVGRRWLQSKFHSVSSSAISVADVEQVLAGRSRTISAIPGRKRRPDWILSVQDPSRRFAVRNYLLESKGAKEVGTVRAQLAGAAIQLNGVGVHGRAPMGLAVSTVSGSGRIKYFAVDPGEEPDPVEIEPSNLEAFVRDGAQETAGGRPEFDQRYFAASSVYWSMFGLADFARNDNAAEWLGETSRDYEDADDRVRSHETGAGPVDGVRRRWRVPGGSLSIVLGVNSEINEALTRRDFEEAMTRQSDWAEQSARREMSRNRTVRPEPESTDPEHRRGEAQGPGTDQEEALAVESDGAVLSVKLE